MESLRGLIIENKYQLIESIGKGGMGAVYLAKDLKLNTYWAVKVIKKNQDEIDFLAEPKMLKMLQHPMLPRITDISESSLYFFIVMDFIDGRTLESLAKERGRIKEELVINWSKQICNALDYLHNLKPNPIIYRDMKPENIMLTKDGNIKIIDFGIAREYKFDASEDTNYLGTRGYAAPEQYRINNSQTDARTDIYGLGVTMYRLLTNKTLDEPPYEVKPVRKFDSKLSEGIEHIVMKSAALDPNLRYKNVRELLYDLDNVKTIGNNFKRKNRARRVKILITIIMMVLSVSLISKGLEKYRNSQKNIYQELSNFSSRIVRGGVKMGLGSFGFVTSGIFCYSYLKEGVEINKNKISMRAARKSMYLKNEINISKQEIKSFNYDTDYLECMMSMDQNDTEVLEVFDSRNILGGEILED